MRGRSMLLAAALLGASMGGNPMTNHEIETTYRSRGAPRSKDHKPSKRRAAQKIVKASQKRNRK